MSPCLDGREREYDDHAYRGARLLCRICNEADRQGKELWDDLKVWWEEHKRLDERDHARCVHCGRTINYDANAGMYVHDAPTSTGNFYFCHGDSGTSAGTKEHP